MKGHILVLVAILATTLSSPISQKSASNSCQSCHKVDPNKINIHLIAHSHDDAGWLKTVDQYFFGLHNDIQRAGVQYIISSTVEALKSNPDRRFVQVETAFFWKWWQHQDDSIKQDFIDLVNNGQLEIINAAWSMNDEAATNYQAVIDQFTWGLRTINDTVGQCGIPRIGWQIDPFGHSREQASIFAQLGFDAVFLGRIDFNDKVERIKAKNMEVVWKASANLEHTNIFTNIFPEFYYPPQGFCFEEYDGDCQTEVLNDDKNSPDYNIPRKVAEFASKMEQLAPYYQTNNVIIPMGGDFHFQAAETNYINMDRLIKAFENHDTINLIYSTPSCYLKAVNDEAKTKNIQFGEKTDDFFPYASGEHSYWTGYFTSRPNAKRLERTANNILQSAKELVSFAKVRGVNHDKEIILLREALGIMQHHDAITGTAKAAVAKDYSRLLAKGIKKVEPTLAEIVTDLLKQTAASKVSIPLKTCILSNVSICEESKAERFVVSIHNPLERPVTHYVRVPVPDGTYQITGPDGVEIADVLDPISNFDYIKNTPETPSLKELVFAAKSIPALGLQLYHVARTGTKSVPPKATDQNVFGTKTNGFEVDPLNGRLKAVTINGKTLPLTQEFLHYQSFRGANNNEDTKASGAYIFRPDGQDPEGYGEKVTITKRIVGNLVDEVHQVVNQYITQIIRVYKGVDDGYVEFDWLVGPLDVNVTTKIGHEVITRFTVSGFDGDETFYTDSNGREHLQRRLRHLQNEPTSSNYYPITSRLSIESALDKTEVAVLPDRAQGGTSLHKGELEFMIHRRILFDDARGVNEPLNDQEFNQGEVVRGTHFLTFGPSSSASGQKSTKAFERELVLKKLLAPVVLVADATSQDLSLPNLQKNLNFEFEGLRKQLPDNVHIMTLEPWKDDTLLLRVEHILEKNEDLELSKTATFSLDGLFTLFDVVEVRETTLGANQWLDEFEDQEKFTWNLKNGGSSINQDRKVLEVGALEINLEPMEIRTFVITVSPVKEI